MAATTATAQATKANRPLGVSIISILTGLVGALFLVVGVLGAVTVLAGLVNVGDVFAPYKISATVGLTILAVEGAIYLALAVGLWRLNFWAWVVSIIFAVADVAVVAYNYATNTSQYSILAGLALMVIVLIYLVAVRQYFN